jgi:transposase
MDEIDKLKQDAREGRINVDRLIDVLAATQQQLHATTKQLEVANLRIAELEKQVGGSPTTKVDQPYSMKAEEKRQEARSKKKKRKQKPKGRRGRITSAEKLQQAERTEAVFPEGVPPSDCKLSHTRPVWRLENGRGVLIAYEIYRGPGHTYGKIRRRLLYARDRIRRDSFQCGEPVR